MRGLHDRNVSEMLILRLKGINAIRDNEKNMKVLKIRILLMTIGFY